MAFACNMQVNKKLVENCKDIHIALFIQESQQTLTIKDIFKSYYTKV